MIHPTAIIDASANIAAGVNIGPYSVIGSDVEIGEGTWIGPHVVINGKTRIGRDNKIFQFNSIGEVPQDKKFEGEASSLEIGDRNTIREYCTFNRGTEHGGGITRIGDDNWIMAYVHIAHDCQVGNDVTMANNATLAGHVTIGDHAILGGFTLVHQFCAVGAQQIAITLLGKLDEWCGQIGFLVAIGRYRSPQMQIGHVESHRCTQVRFRNVFDGCILL